MIWPGLASSQQFRSPVQWEEVASDGMPDVAVSLAGNLTVVTVTEAIPVIPIGQEDDPDFRTLALTGALAVITVKEEIVP